jgi:hypothetical protein
MSRNNGDSTRGDGDRHPNQRDKTKQTPIGLNEVAIGAALGLGLFAAGSWLFGGPKTIEKAPPSTEKVYTNENKTERVENAHEDCIPFVTSEDDTGVDFPKLKNAYQNRKKEFNSAETENQLFELAKTCFIEAGGNVLAEEWECNPGKSNEGKGDLVFELDGFHCIVECKHLSQSTGHTQREQRRQNGLKVKEQAKYYHKEWPIYRKKHLPYLPERPVLAFTCTNDGFEKIC